MIHDSNLIFRIIKYSIEKDVIVKQTLFSDLNLTDHERSYFDSILKSDDPSNIMPHNILVLFSKSASTNHFDYQYKLIPTAIFQYIDYLEIREARLAAKSANRIAWIAILISVSIGLLDIIFK